MSESLTTEDLLKFEEWALNPNAEKFNGTVEINRPKFLEMVSMARRCLSAEERLERAVEALVKISSGTMECGHCTRGETTPEELATETLLKLKGLGTPKELRPRQECAPHVEPDVVPIDAFLKLRAADQMAKIIDEMVDSDTLNARSRLADVRLDYGQPHQYEHLKRNNVSPGINPLAHGADERPLGNPNKLKTL
jgi:hypothetical protein